MIFRKTSVMQVVMQLKHVKLKCFAALAEVSVDDIKGSIGFWTCDRASGRALMSKNLDVESKK